MRNFFLGLVITIVTLTSCFADQTPPIGLQEMMNSLASVSNPQDANGKTFELKKPKNFENFALSLYPSIAFAVSNLKDGSVIVNIAKSSALYDMDLFNNTGIVVLKSISFEWKFGDIINPDNKGEGFQSCSLNVGFKINNTVLTKTTLDYFKNNNYALILNYDKNILDYTGNIESEFIFKRKNNNDVSVSLTVNKPDGSFLAEGIVSNLAKCEQSASTTSPKWSDWTDWNSCSMTCGGGKQSKTRTCLTEQIGIPCVGNSFEERECNTQACLPKKSANDYIASVIENYSETYWPPITRKFKYDLRFKNTSDFAIKCIVRVYAVNSRSQGKVDELNFTLKPQEISDRFEGKVGTGSYDADSAGYDKYCEFVK